MKRSANAIWKGTLKDGSGSFGVASKAIVDQKYSFRTRFEDAPGTNPEELIAAAHASCFSMALSGKLEANGTPASRIETSAACTVEKVGDAFAVTTMALTVRVSAAGIENDAFQALAAATKDGCPISKAIKGNVNITLDAQLV